MNIPPDLYFTILKTLSKKGILIDSDISNLLFKYFNNENLIDDYWNLKESKISAFLQPMRDANHIHYKIEHYQKKGNAHDEIKVLANITPVGLNYYKTNFSKFNWNNFWVAIAAVSTVLIALIGWLTFSYESTHKDGNTLKKPYLKPQQTQKSKG